MISAVTTVALVLLFAAAAAVITLAGLALNAPVGEADISQLDDWDRPAS